jgi:hypothetical protein
MSTSTKPVRTPVRTPPTAIAIEDTAGATTRYMPKEYASGRLTSDPELVRRWRIIEPSSEYVPVRASGLHRRESLPRRLSCDTDRLSDPFPRMTLLTRSADGAVLDLEQVSLVHPSSAKDFQRVWVLRGDQPIPTVPG